MATSKLHGSYGELGAPPASREGLVVKEQGKGRRLLELLPPNSAQSWTGMALLVIRGADFDLIPCLLQPSHMFPIRPGLHARRRRVCLEGIRDKFKALVQQRTDLGVACGDQRKIGLFLVSAIWASWRKLRALVDIGMIPQARALRRLHIRGL